MNSKSLWGSLERHQFGWFVLASLGILALAPRIPLALGDFLAERVLHISADLDFAGLPYVPLTLPLAVALALLTFFLSQKARIRILVVAILPLAWVHGRLDERSVLPIALFLVTAWAIIRTPVPRQVAAFLLIVLSTMALWAGATFLRGHPVVGATAVFPVMVPMLWYSAYEHGRAPLPLQRFVAYMSGRMFGSPVYTYADMFRSVDAAELRATRWAGIRAIYIALLATFVAKGWEWSFNRVPPDGLRGFPLLAMSYVGYVGYYCTIVARLNMFIGGLRLFGFPIRDNFRYWLLAKTPNEHWQRWNLLAREWVLTFVFFPIMRARRWLFAAVMAAMGVAWVLHQFPLLFTTGFHAPRMVASLIYWGANGLAIYAVIRAPQLYPRLVARLRMPGSRVWAVAGIALTSAFYAVLHGLRTESGSWAEMANYLLRLVGLAPF